MKIVIEMDMQPYDQVSDEPNEMLARAVYVTNVAASRLAAELPMPTTVEKVQVER